jgi:hypothetical protein
MVRDLHFHHTGEVLPENWLTVGVQIYAGETPPPDDVLCFVNIANHGASIRVCSITRSTHFPSPTTCITGRYSCGIASLSAWSLTIRLSRAIHVYQRDRPLLADPKSAEAAQ